MRREGAVMGRSGERKRAAWSPRHISVGWLGWSGGSAGKAGPPPRLPGACRRSLRLWYLKGQAWGGRTDGAFKGCITDPVREAVLIKFGSIIAGFVLWSHYGFFNLVNLSSPSPNPSTSLPQPHDLRTIPGIFSAPLESRLSPCSRWILRQTEKWGRKGSPDRMLCGRGACRPLSSVPTRSAQHLVF